jgi:hypothetical protein
MNEILKRIPKMILARVLPYRATHREKEEWDAQYANSDWGRLRDLDERARYSVIAGYMS